MRSPEAHVVERKTLLSSTTPAPPISTFTDMPSYLADTQRSTLHALCQLVQPCIATLKLGCGADTDIRKRAATHTFCAYANIHTHMFSFWMPEKRVCVAVNTYFGFVMFVSIFRSFEVVGNNSSQSDQTGTDFSYN